MSRREAPGNFPPSLEHSPRGKFLGCFPLLPLTLAPPRSHRASNCARGARRAGRESPSAWYRRPRVINYPSAGLALSGRLSRQGSNRAAAGGWERSRSDSGRTQGPRRVWVHGGGRVGGEPSGPTTPRPAKGARGECSHRESGPERRPPAASGRVHSLPLALRADPAGRPAGKPAEPRSAPRPAAPETRSQSRRCERPAFLGLFGRKTYLEKADTLTKSSTQSGRYLCWVVAFSLFNGNQRNKLRIRKTQAAHWNFTTNAFAFSNFNVLSPFSLRSPWGSHEVTLHIPVT